MCVRENWNVDNILTLISIVFAMVGGIFAFHQWNISNKIKRSEYINQIIKKLRFDNEMTEAMFIVEYDHSWYDENFHNGEGKMEHIIDKLLSYMSYI